MRILAVDDKEMPRKVLVRAIRQVVPDAELTVCRNATEVLDLAGLSEIDVAFVDIDLPGMGGIELAQRLKKANPCVNIIFATGYDEYMADAFALHSSGYLLKPITPDDVRAELNNLRFPPAPHRGDKALTVRCFGDFEVFCDGQVVTFERTKTKELFAYLIDRRGAIVRQREAEVALWEERPDGSAVSASYLRTLVADLRRSLERWGQADILIKRRGELGVDVSRLSCDYYDYVNGDPRAINLWRGEYMSQYSWAETTKASLL